MWPTFSNRTVNSTFLSHSYSRESSPCRLHLISRTTGNVWWSCITATCTVVRPTLQNCAMLHLTTTPPGLIIKSCVSPARTDNKSYVIDLCNFLNNPVHTVIDPYVRQRVVRCCHILLRWTSEIAASGDRQSWFPDNNIAVNHHLRAQSVNNLQDGGQNTAKLHIILTVAGKSATNVRCKTVHSAALSVLRRIYQTLTRYYASKML